jgi:tight adherence protein B
VNQAIENIVLEQPLQILIHTRGAVGETANLLEALSRDAEQIESSELNQLVKILNINKTSGASITDALDMMIKTALIRQERTHQIAAELSGIKATITVLALLPIFGSFLGMMMGVNVPYWLLMNRVGWICLALACVFEVLGLLWVRKLIRGVS